MSTCGEPMPTHETGYLSNTLCGRPEGHDGRHWPVPLADDQEDT